jgi:DNA-binding CsgD family transcriptional regulator
MVGRSTELDRLVGLLGITGDPAIALVAGEAGIGKTRLVKELVSRVPPGALVFAGQADPGTVGRPMELFLDALETLDESLVQPHTELVAAARDDDRPAEERMRAGVDLVRRLTADTPGLVVFEDVHWADPESLTVFEQLAQPAGSRLLLVGTYRPDGLSRRHPAAELLPRLDRRHSITHLHLTRLSLAEVTSFLTAVYGQAPSFRVVHALHGRTGGNPFFLEELVASSAGSGTIPCDLDTLPLPWTVAELVRAHLDELAADVRRIVVAASVLGRRVSFDLLAAVTGTAEDDLIDRLRGAVDAGLLVEIDPDVFGFHHEIAREAIAGGLLGRERRRLHEAALDALRRAGSHDHGALARHARGAGRYDDMVDEARLGAHELLARGSSYPALELAEMGLSEADDDLDLLSVAARASWLAGVLDSVGHCERWHEVARAAGDVGEEAAALCLRARVAYDAGDLEAMASFTDAVVTLVDQIRSDEQRAQAMAFVAQSYMLRDQVDATCEWADKAHALADAHGLAAVRLAAMVEKGSVLLHQAESAAEGQALLDVAIAEAERTGEHVLASRALNNLVWHAREWDQIDEVRALVVRMHHQAEAAGWLEGSANVEALAHIAAVEGDLDRAIAQLDEGMRSDSGQGLYAKRRWAAVFRAGLALEAGDLDSATLWADKARPATQRTGASLLGLDLHLACRQGRLGDVRRLLTELVTSAADSGCASPSQVHDVVSGGLHAGLSPGDLRPLADHAGGYAGHRLAPDDPWRLLIDAQFAEADQRTDEAADLYMAAAGGLSAAPEVLAGHRGSAHTGAARCLVALGRLDEARSHIEAAGGYLARWGGWRVDELRAVERRLGIGPDPSGPDSLTPREREVAALLAEGLSNAQLAERLYISPRTAAVHVSNILAKLGMASRTEVAAWAASGGLTAVS